MRSLVNVDDAPFEDLLATYVRDHLAGAAGGVALARRAARTTGTLDPAAGRSLERLAGEIAVDRQLLRRCAAALGIRRPWVREVGALVTERLGRLKLNAQLTGTSALSPVLELDLLIMALSGKARGWRTLAILAPDGVPNDVDLEQLQRRSLAQREELESLQDRLVPGLRTSGRE